MKNLTATICLTIAVLLGSVGAVYALPPCPSDQNQYYDNCFSTFTFANGNKYVGELRNDKSHGQGTYTFADGRIKEGIWKDDKFQYAQKVTPTVTARKSPSPTRLELARRTQEALQVLGLYSGKLDGIIGVKTRSGIQRWQKRNGYAGTGEVTEAQLTKLEQEAITQIAKKQSKPKVAEKKKPPPRSDPNKVISVSSGSGFAVSSDGHVITNNHVIYGCQRVIIHHKGKSIPATVVTFDPQHDLALLKGDFRPSTVLPLSTNSPELLQDVYVAGYPFGRKISTGVKVTKGIISSLTGIGNNFANIQIDAALQPGNSGGPILDDKGNVVGVAVAKLDIKKILKNFGVIPEDTNFGIKTSVVKSILESSNVSFPGPNGSPISKTNLGRMISDGTYYLSCWMTIS